MTSANGVKRGGATSTETGLLSSRVSGGPRCYYMDGHVILNTQGVLDSAVAPAKGIRTGCPDAPSDGFVSHGEREMYKLVDLLLGIKRLPGGSLSSSCEGIYIQLQGYCSSH